MLANSVNNGTSSVCDIGNSSLHVAVQPTNISLRLEDGKSSGRDYTFTKKENSRRFTQIFSASWFMLFEVSEIGIIWSWQICLKPFIMISSWSTNDCSTWIYEQLLIK